MTGRDADRSAVTTAYDFAADTLLDREPESLDRYRGKVLLIVNMASKCGFTPQYKGLEKLHRELPRRRVSSCSASRATSSGTRSPTPRRRSPTSARTTYDVTFPMFAKVDVNGDDAHPLFRWLRARRAGCSATRSSGTSPSSWSTATGRRQALRTTTKPESIAGDIERHLARPCGFRRCTCETGTSGYCSGEVRVVRR